MTRKKDKKSTEQPTKAAPESHPVEPDLFETRLAKLDAAKKTNNPYDQSFKRTHTLAEPAGVPAEQLAEGMAATQIVYVVAGRVRSKRLMGKAGFLDLEDESGKLQIYGSEKETGESFTTFHSLDLGDIVGFRGTLFVTRTGQVSLKAQKITLLAKCLRPLPVVKEADGKVFDAFTDKESRYRMRYVDLIVNPQVRKTFLIRSRIV